MRIDMCRVSLAISTLVLMMLFSGCATFGKPTEIKVTIDDPARIRFSGKGAGAGMMLSSSMGPMGIAIGVAIDEGIGKQIDENANQSSFSIQETIKHAFHNSRRNLAITVKRYGFVLARGDYSEDRVIPELELEIRSHDAEPALYKFPDNFENPDSAPNKPQQTWSLEEVKTNPQAVMQAFDYAAQQLARVATTPQ